MARFTLLSYEFRGVQTAAQQGEPELFETLSKSEIEANFEKKQELFGLFFDTEHFPQTFEFNGRYYNVNLVWNYNDIIVFQMEKKGWTNQALNFKNKKIPNNPWIDIIVDNRYQQQLIAVRKNTTMFKYVNTVAKILEANFSAWMTRRYGLEVSVKQQYRSKVFWDIYKRFDKSHHIEKLEFKFPFPNKDWISEQIERWMQFGKARNGATRLGLEAEKNESLYFEENEENKAVVNACSGTGADVIIKPKNHRAIHVVKEMNPIEQEMSDSTLEKVLDASAQQSIFEENDLTPYLKAGEFLNKCKQYYE